MMSRCVRDPGPAHRHRCRPPPMGANVTTRDEIYDVASIAAYTVDLGGYDIDQDLADRAVLHRGMGVAGTFQREVVQRKARFVADADRAVEPARP